MTLSLVYNLKTVLYLPDYRRLTFCELNNYFFCGITAYLVTWSKFCFETIVIYIYIYTVYNNSFETKAKAAIVF